jgi:Family of unknown function (DUF6270)/Heparinase II/III-like protein
MNGPTKLLIFGSCVSRDIFNYPYDKAQMVLVDFYCRSSIASLVAQPIEIPPAVQNIASPFQKRMAERDMTKDFLKNLPGLQFDYLLLDLIDERLSLYVEPDGRACTISPALIGAGFPGESNGGSTIHSGTEEFWRLWEAGWLILADKLRGLGLLDRLLVNQVFWGSRMENGGIFDQHYPSEYIDSANKFLDRMYQRITADIPSEQFLRFDHGLMTGSLTHRWGISPFHYIDAYYQTALQQLTLLSSSSLYAPQCSKNDSPLVLKDVLAIRMDRIVDDFPPFDGTVRCSGDTVALPLFTKEIMEVSLSQGVQWERKFAQQAKSSVMWLFSLEPIGRLLSTFQQKHDDDALRIAVVALNSFLDYSNESNQRSSIGSFPSADHSAATRVKVFIKFIQVMRERPDVDYALLNRVCECLKYWSDWLSDDKNYEKGNHGLMGSIALLHSAVQFGVAPHSSLYVDVATNRIIELGKSSFDRDGLCNENTIVYHNFNVHCYRGVLEFCTHYGGSDTLVNFLEELILRATTALEFCVWQDGSIPSIGDGGVYRLNIASRNEPRCFYESGFAVVKNDNLYLSILCGARSEIHKQVDDSSITLRFMNREILVDGGSYIYDRTNRHRRCVESSLGHSGLFLKEFDSLLRSEFLQKYGPVSGKIERFEESDDGVRVKCLYSVSNGRVVFVRNIFVCWPEEIAIVDSVELREEVASHPETVQRFLFGPTLDVQFDGRNKLILAADEFECTLFQLLDCDGVLYRGEDANPVRGWCSYKYMEILPTYGVDFVRHLQRSRFATIIKLAKCADLSECSTRVRAFADGTDPFVSQCVSHSTS